MKFLEEFGIGVGTIEMLERICSNDEIKSLEYNADILYGSIEYLKSIGLTIETIEKIMIEDHHILIAGENHLRKAVNKVDKNKLVSALNNNIEYMCYLKNFS